MCDFSCMYVWEIFLCVITKNIMVLLCKYVCILVCMYVWIFLFIILSIQFNLCFFGGVMFLFLFFFIYVFVILFNLCNTSNVLLISSVILFVLLLLLLCLYCGLLFCLFIIVKTFRSSKEMFITIAFSCCYLNRIYFFFLWFSNPLVCFFYLQFP